MPKKLLLFIITLVSFSCSRNNKKSVEDSVNPSDFECIHELNKAKTDIKNGKLIYCNYSGDSFRRGQEEMESLLKANNIDYKNESSPHVVEKNKNYHCYCELMEEKIKEKYGEKFTDSLLYIADSLYILKNLNETYYQGSVYGSYDKPALFPGDTHYDDTNHYGLQKAFDKIIVYPKKYRKKGKNSMAFLSVELDIDKEGNVKVTDNYFYFWDSKTNEENYNKEFESYIKKVAFSLLEKTQWIPAKIKGINVNSKQSFYIYLK